MADDPKYVRLASRLSRGMVADVNGSGWSISGLDVRKFPEDKDAQRFVRAQLNAGKLEPASKAEWEDAHDTTLEKEVLEQNPEYRQTASAVQEARVQRAAQASREKVAKKLKADEEAELEQLSAEEEEDRQARLAEQEEMDLMTDDPKKQKARTAGQTPRKKPSGAKRKSSKKDDGGDS